jgi:hypothetical protein
MGLAMTRHGRPPRFKAGDQFMRLTILADAGRCKSGRVYLVRCTCGTVKTVRGCDVRLDRTISCGCAARHRARTCQRVKGQFAGTIPTPAEIALLRIMRADAQHEPGAST